MGRTEIPNVPNCQLRHTRSLDMRHGRRSPGAVLKSALILWIAYVAMTIPCLVVSVRFVGNDWAISWGNFGLHAIYWGDFSNIQQSGLRNTFGRPGFHIENVTRFQISNWFRIPVVTSRQICFSHWMLFPIVNVVVLLAYVHCKRLKVGRCHGCFYDLTGNVTGICSECGASIIRDNRHRFPSGP
jgi:hypothetical protein